jgi:hypothetical protein
MAQRVVHRRFGMGTIIAIDATANGPVGHVAFDAVEMLDQPVCCIRLTVAHSLEDNAPFDITLFAPARTLEGPPPVAGDDVEAVIWLTGYRMDG